MDMGLLLKQIKVPVSALHGILLWGPYFLVGGRKRVFVVSRNFALDFAAGTGILLWDGIVSHAWLFCV